MTREEAIEQLKNCKELIKQDGQDYLDERDFPLLDMAIEALSREQKKYDAICDELLELKSDLMLPIEVAMAVVMKYAERGGAE